ncbi:hypothetical protein [Sessilibacter sp. MAH4]
MNSTTPPYDKNLLKEALIDSAKLTRYAVDSAGQPDKNHPVMTTEDEVVIFDKGTGTWSFDVNGKITVNPTATSTPYIEVDAQWLDTQAALETGVRVIHGGSANSFGGLGALLVPDAFCIPTVIADQDNVKHYGLTLIPAEQTFTVKSDNYEIVMMEYDYTKDYKKDFLMQKYGGGGIFVETHDFPHIHIPTTADCGGYIVIGKQLSATKFHFTAFQIPFGYALYTPSYTIHGDGTLVGVYALTVGDSAFVSANTVLMYNENTLTMAMDVVPDWPPQDCR